MTIQAADLISVLNNVTKEWTNQRKAEERSHRSRDTRKYAYSDRVDFTKVAPQILPVGYAHASGDGKYTVDKRQFYYAVRDEFLNLTGREISADYFSQTLLVKYMNQHPKETAHWKITASPRGTLSIPNTGYDLRIPCGTIAIEEHLRESQLPCDPFVDLRDILLRIEWPSLAEGQRYQAVLYIEKEGFDPQLREARIAERFDLAIISCKGQSVVAARQYVDHVCRVNGGVPLFIIHDFDKSGFEISQRLTTVSDHVLENDLVKYVFRNQVRVIDLGLRLADAQKYNLKSESFRFRGQFPHDTIATKEEQAFLSSGRRIELNAFTAPQFIQWIEESLVANGLRQRLIPNDQVLANAYRRATATAWLNNLLQVNREEAIEKAKGAHLPRGLRRKLQEALKDSSQPWDGVLYDLVKAAGAL